VKETMTEEKANEVRTVFERFLVARNAEWLASYGAAVEWVQRAPEGEFRTREFQRRLWEIEGVTGIGPGDSVLVPGAYEDPEIVEALWTVRALTHCRVIRSLDVSCRHEL
jgi:hypothetical protein